MTVYTIEDKHDFLWAVCDSEETAEKLRAFLEHEHKDNYFMIFSQTVLTKDNIGYY